MSLLQNYSEKDNKIWIVLYSKELYDRNKIAINYYSKLYKYNKYVIKHYPYLYKSKKPRYYIDTIKEDIEYKCNEMRWKPKNFIRDFV